MAHSHREPCTSEMSLAHGGNCARNSRWRGYGPGEPEGLGQWRVRFFATTGTGGSGAAHLGQRHDRYHRTIPNVRRTMPAKKRIFASDWQRSSNLQRPGQRQPLRGEGCGPGTRSSFRGQRRFHCARRSLDDPGNAPRESAPRRRTGRRNPFLADPRRFLFVIDKGCVTLNGSVGRVTATPNQ